jgi:hypothetical protein
MEWSGRAPFLTAEWRWEGTRVPGLISPTSRSTTGCQDANGAFMPDCHVVVEPADRGCRFSELGGVECCQHGPRLAARVKNQHTLKPCWRCGQAAACRSAAVGQLLTVNG